MLLKLNENPEHCLYCQAESPELRKMPSVFSSPALKSAAEATSGVQATKETSNPAPESGKARHTHGACRKGYIDNLLKRYDKSL